MEFDILIDMDMLCQTHEGRISKLSFDISDSSIAILIPCVTISNSGSMLILESILLE